MKNFDDLFDEFTDLILEKNPDKSITEQQYNHLKEKWRGKQKQLKQVVLEMRTSKNKAINEAINTERRVVEFQIGISLSGEPIVVKHYVEIKNKFFDTKKGYNKRGSKDLSTIKTGYVPPKFIF